MNVRILIVEDDPVQCRGMERALRSIPEEVQQRHGIDSLEIAMAVSAKGASQLLASAKKQLRTYDVALVDLSLPAEDGGRDENERRGQEILHMALGNGTIRKAVVISAFHQHSHIIGAFRGGAVDFIAKPYEEAELRHRVLLCWDLLVRDLCANTLERRIESLVPEAQRSFLRRRDRIYSSLRADIRRDVQELTDMICERQALDVVRDAEDPIIKCIHTIDQKLDRAPFPPQSEASEESTTTIQLAQIFTSVRTRVAPCLRSKGLNVEWPREVSSSVSSFDNGVQMVICEIVLGTIVQMENTESTEAFHAIFTVNPTAENERVALTYEDTVEALPKESRDLINNGGIIRADNFNRAWGLAVMQQIAAWGGGRIQVEAREGGGNRITYFIPKAVQ